MRKAPAERGAKRRRSERGRMPRYRPGVRGCAESGKGFGIVTSARFSHAENLAGTRRARARFRFSPFGRRRGAALALPLYSLHSGPCGNTSLDAASLPRKTPKRSADGHGRLPLGVCVSVFACICVSCVCLSVCGSSWRSRGRPDVALRSKTPREPCPAPPTSPVMTKYSPSRRYYVMATWGNLGQPGEALCIY